MAFSKQIKKIHAEKHPVKKRTEEERERDLEIISRLFLTVKPTLQQAVILLKEETKSEYTISFQQISYDLDTIRKRWMESANEKMDAIKSRELAKIDAIEKEAWDSWIKSKGEQTVATRKIIGSLKEANEDKELQSEINKMQKKTLVSGSTVKKEHGDTRYMNLIMWCIDKRIEILGIKEATKIKVSVSKEQEQRQYTSQEELDKEIESATKALNEIKGIIDITSIQKT